VFAKFALQDEILGIANGYMGLHSQLRYYNVWHTLANTGPARESQLWHRDRDDYLTCKVFLYLNDVDEGAGPFTYAKGTHPKGKNHAEPPFTLEGTVKRSDDTQMAIVAPRETWLKATGRKAQSFLPTRADTTKAGKPGPATGSCTPVCSSPPLRSAGNDERERPRETPCGSRRCPGLGPLCVILRKAETLKAES